MSVSRLTVLTPSADRYLITVADARERLGLESTDDTLLGELLIEAGSMIEHYLGRQLARQRYLEALPGVDAYRVHLSALPVEASTLAVEVSDVAETGFALENVETGQLYLSGGWPCGSEQDIEATYYAGYLLPDRVADWAVATAKTAGQWVRPTSAGAQTRFRFECTTAGTTHATTQPTWTTADEAGDTITDNTVTWTARDAYELPPDLSRIAWLAVRNLWDARTRPSGITRMEADGFAEYYSTGAASDGDLPDYITRALDRWRYR